MDQDPKNQHEKKPQEEESGQGPLGDSEMNRRDFFTSLGKWSKIVIAAVLLGPSILPEEAESMIRSPAPGGMGGWVDQATPKPGWTNQAGGGTPKPGGGGWGNRGVWANGGVPWAHTGGGWANRGGTALPWNNRAPESCPGCPWGQKWYHEGSGTPRISKCWRNSWSDACSQ